jgi:hypothetical protein
VFRISNKYFPNIFEVIHVKWWRWWVNMKGRF